MRPPTISNIATLSFLVALSFFPAISSADEASEQAMWKAISAGDAKTLRMVLPTADVNKANAAGETPLMVASAQGNFECARELLWAGADPTAKTSGDKVAHDFLRPAFKGFVPVDLLLRCYIMPRGQGTRQAKAGVRHRVLINDAYVDHTNPRLKPHYYVNAKEAEGKAEVDDDGNGFVDDIYGWNASDDTPLQIPEMITSSGESSRTWLERLVADYEQVVNEAPGFEAIRDRLSVRHENPLVKKIGIALAQEAGLAINDLNYAKMVCEASHGTHVAGIVLTASNGVAELHGLGWGQFNEITEDNLQGMDRIVALSQEIAPNAPTYRDFVLTLRNELLKDARKSGQRFSNYVKTSQAGVINMSWGKDLEVFRRLAGMLHDIYAKTGKDPASIANFSCPAGMDLCDNLALELVATDAASMALAIYQNPDVLFVMSAGNDSGNNDKLLPSPAYLSRFFPNVITVASIDRQSRLSRFSNFGARSVQIGAPGENILSDFLGGVKGHMSGTSMAAPQVSGAAAAIRSKHPELDASAVRRILLASAVAVPELRGLVATGATLDLPAALELADRWKNGGGALVNEFWDWPPGDDEAGEVLHQSPVDLIEMPPTIPANGPAITTSAGFGDKDPSWVLVMSEGSGLTDQQVKMNQVYPNDWINGNFHNHRRITSIAGDNSGWTVVMSHGDYEQRVVGFDYDQTTISKNMNEGFPITATAGWGDKWVFVMDQHCSYGAQRYTLPGAFDQGRQDWIAKLWDQDYRITSIAGDEGPGDKDSWVVVMSRNSGIGEQSYSGQPGAWPVDFIKGKFSEGFVVTGISGHAPGSWVVVMSKGPALIKQQISLIGAFPGKWIQEQWNVSTANGKLSLADTSSLGNNIFPTTKRK